VVIPLPKRGPSTPELWSQKSDIIYDHIAAGSFDTAMKLLNRKFKIVHFDGLREMFMNIYRSSNSVFIGHPSTNPLPFHLNRNWKERGSRHLPIITLTLTDQIENLKNAYKNVTEGKFAQAIDDFKNILITLPLVVVEDEEKAEVKEIINLCKEYIIGLSCEMNRRTATSDERQIELSIYFSYCGLQSGHQKLALKQAMKLAANKKNYGQAYILASKLLDFTLNQQDEEMAQKILKHCESRERTDALQVDFDDRNPFHLCAYHQKPIYYGTPTAECRYCGAKYFVDRLGELCNVCQLSKVSE